MTGVVNAFNKHLLEVSPKWYGDKIGSFAKRALKNEDHKGVTRAKEVLAKTVAHIRKMNNVDNRFYWKYFKGAPYPTPIKMLKDTVDDTIVRPKKWVSPITDRERIVRLNHTAYAI